MSDRLERLETLRDELIDRLERYRADKTRAGGPLDKDLEEQSIELESAETIDSLENEAEEELIQVMHALARIREGQGENCENCGELIDEARLSAVPFTTLCRDCAEAG
ncbi:TraR/DksA C4-type zinc finger protein [Halomonas organivorans]